MHWVVGGAFVPQSSNSEVTFPHVPGILRVGNPVVSWQVWSIKSRNVYVLGSRKSWFGALYAALTSS
jgi:hypothetical protein